MEKLSKEKVAAAQRLKLALISLILSIISVSLILLLCTLDYSRFGFGNYRYIAITAENYNLTSFPTCDISPEESFYHQYPANLVGNPSSNGPSKSNHFIEKLPEYIQNNLTTILQSTEFPARSYISSSGFVKTVLDAYRNHHNLVLRPDDIWAAIMTQFSFYVNKNAEKLRSKFVNFEGKKELVIELYGPNIYTVPYDQFVTEMTAEIDRNLVDPKVKEWIMPSFSTTTQNDYVSIGVVFMATMKHYFEYVARIACGIPKITVDGTVQDWKDILGRLEKLKEYELDNWHDMLYPIISKFVEAKEGKVDGKFWKAIVSKREGAGGCGPPNRISGWITAFCVFDKDGNWKASKSGNDEEEESDMFGKLRGLWNSMTTKWPEINIDDIPRGVVEVDVTLDEHGTNYKSMMLAGHMAVEVKEDGATLQPVLGWAIALKP